MSHDFFEQSPLLISDAIHQVWIQSIGRFAVIQRVQIMLLFFVLVFLRLANLNVLTLTPPVQVIDVIQYPVLNLSESLETFTLLLEGVLLCEVSKLEELLVVPLLTDLRHLAEAQIDRMLLNFG